MGERNEKIKFTSHKGEKCGISVGGVKLQKASFFPVLFVLCCGLSVAETQLAGLQVRYTENWELCHMSLSDSHFCRWKKRGKCCCCCFSSKEQERIVHLVLQNSAKARNGALS